MTGPRLVLVALAIAFGFAVTFATLTTVKQVHTSSVAPHTGPIQAPPYRNIQPSPA